MDILQNDDYTNLIDNPMSLRCPHCSTQTAIIPISIPRFQLVHRYSLSEVGIVYRCSSCNKPIFLKHNVLRRANPIGLSDSYQQIAAAVEPFETQYLSGDVLADFSEALLCYANSCWNAFASMSRRCIQSVSAAMGATGTSKVQNQLEELKSLGIADEETFAQLQAIILSGHDGAHPHLPKLTPERAEILMHVLKDVLYQLYVRPAKIKEASELRKKAIEQKKS